MPEANLFYVIFHGLISLIEFKDHFLAVIVDMGQEHQVSAGHWLTEDPLPRGSMELVGLKSGSAGLDPASNLLISVPDLDQEELKKIQFGVITMPKPRQAYSFCTGHISGELKGVDAVKATVYSATQIFEYEWSGQFSGIALQSATGRIFEPIEPITLKTGASFSVMHILNEPERRLDASHSVDEFNTCMRLLPGVDITAIAPLGFPTQLPVAMPVGVLHQELASLSERRTPIYEALAEARLANVGMMFHAVSGSHFCGGPHAEVGG